MILKFSFFKRINNGLLENIIHKILHTLTTKAPFTSALTYTKNETFLYIDADEENIEDTADEFSKLLPISIFYGLEKAEVVEEKPESLELPDCSLNLPITALMQRDFLENEDIFLKPEIGENLGESLPLIYNEKTANTPEECKEVLHHTVEDLKNGKTVSINTRAGKKTIGVLNEQNSELLKESEFSIMPCDITIIGKMFIASNEEINALASLEKPLINLRQNLISINKNFIPTIYADVQLADTLLLYFISRQMFKNGYEYLFLTDAKADNTLSYTQTKTVAPLKVSVLENGAIIPFENHQYLSTQKIPDFEKISHERFTTLIYEHNLFEKVSTCFYLSKKYDDSVMVYSEPMGLVELFELQVPSSINQVFEGIKSSENGAKLLEKYEKEFGKIKNVEFKNPAYNFFTLLGVAGIFLGFGDDLQTSAENLLLKAKKSSAPKGPRIDILEEGEKYPKSINFYKFIQSGLSFRLAGVDVESLSYGYIESIAYFLSSLSDKLAKEFESEYFCFAGSLFEFKRLIETSAKNIQPNHKVCVNRAFSQDK